MSKQKKIYFSHSMSVDGCRKDLEKSFKKIEGFLHRVYAQPMHNPLAGAKSDQEVVDRVSKRMSACDVLIINANAPRSAKQWIDIEVKVANSEDRGVKRIIAIECKERTAEGKALEALAELVVPFDAVKIADAVKKLTE